MKGIGETLKEKRVKKKISLEALSKKTKIRGEFISAIEKEEWVKLPEFPVVLGFVKNIAGALGFNDQNAAALLKRDYPPKDLKINPNPDLSKKFSWNPKFAFRIGIILVSIVVFGYLLYQYISFLNPPKLDVDFPKDNQVVTQSKIFVSGNTETDATLKVNNQPVLLDADGNFSAEIEIFEGTKVITVVAKSRSGKESVVTRKINVELKS